MPNRISGSDSIRKDFLNNAKARKTALFSNRTYKWYLSETGFFSFITHSTTHPSKGQPQTSQRKNWVYSPKDWRIPEVGSLERCMMKSFSKFLMGWQGKLL